MPAAELLGPDGRADARAVIKTNASAVTCADARADARTDDGDARADASTVRGTHTCSVAKTDNRSPVVEADAVALFV